DLTLSIKARISERLEELYDTEALSRCQLREECGTHLLRRPPNKLLHKLLRKVHSPPGGPVHTAQGDDGFHRRFPTSIEDALLKEHFFSLYSSVFTRYRDRPRGYLTLILDGNLRHDEEVSPF